MKIQTLLGFQIKRRFQKSFLFFLIVGIGFQSCAIIPIADDCADCTHPSNSTVEEVCVVGGLNGKKRLREAKENYENRGYTCADR